MEDINESGKHTEFREHQEMVAAFAIDILQQCRDKGYTNGDVKLLIFKLTRMSSYCESILPFDMRDASEIHQVC